MSEETPPPDKPDTPPVDPPEDSGITLTKDDVKPLIIETRDANVTEAMQASLDTLQKKITEQETMINDLTSRNTNIQKEGLIKQIKDAGYDVTDMEKHTLETLIGIASTLSQTSKSIVIKNEKKEQLRGATIMDPSTGEHKKFYDRSLPPPKS